MTKFYINSGEGEDGTLELYTGKLSNRAIKSRLTKERQNGDRWASLCAEMVIDVDDIHYDALDYNEELDSWIGEFNSFNFTRGDA